MSSENQQQKIKIDIPVSTKTNTIDFQSLAGAQSYQGPITVKENFFYDQHGRTLLLRGVNLSGGSKMPVTPELASQYGTPEFFDHRNVSFVGRPFAPKDAIEHFERLSKWGLTFCRMLVPWESLEHKGPGIYDEEFIDSLIVIFNIMNNYGMKCLIDPHQDTWSRFTGGSGAPGWTFEVAGLDIKNFEVTGAVHYHDFSDSSMNSKMIWPTNYSKLASATMFTLFFGGNDFAPQAKYKGHSCQDFLQSHYINCYRHLMERLKNCDAVIGIEAMNEPHYGYIGLANLEQINTLKELRLANSPTPIQCFALGSGHTSFVEYWRKSWPFPTRKTGYRELNKEKASAWLPGKSCIWKTAGVWTDADGTPKLSKPDYFKFKPDGTVANFNDDYFAPFLKKFAEQVRNGNPNVIFFFEPVPNEDPPKLKQLYDMNKDFLNTVYAPHWYDLASVFNKSFKGYLTHDIRSLSRGTKNIFQATYFGLEGARSNYAYQVAQVKVAGKNLIGNIPCLMGECGIPMDINEKKAFASGNYVDHTNFLDAVIRAMETNLVHFTLWNYNPHNDNDTGDYWNGEDFSIFSTTTVNPPSESKTASSSKVAVAPKSENDTSGPSLQSPAERISKAFRSKSSLAKDFIQNIGGSKTNITPEYAELHSPSSVFDLVEDVFDERFEGDHHIGGRALDAVIRPYAAKIAGKPLSNTFVLEKLAFELIFSTPKYGNFNSKTQLSNVTEIFVPNFHYGTSNEPIIKVSGGAWSYDSTKETVYWTIDPSELAPNNKSIKWIANKKVVEENINKSEDNIHTIQIFYDKDGHNWSLNRNRFLHYCTLL